MHLNHGVPKITALLLGVVLLTGCTSEQSTAEQQVQEMRSLYQSMESLTASGEITADYSDRVYTYTVDIEGDETSGSMTVTSPENISGTVIQWTDDQLSINVDAVSLETGELSESGFSPADAVPAILKACKGGMLLGYSLEEEEGTQLLWVEFQNTETESSTISCAFDPDTYLLRRAEIAEDGRTIITLELDSAQIILESKE